MKKFDEVGLRLAEYQGQIFEASVKKCACSSLVFIRRFFKSVVSERIDNSNNNVLLDVNYAIEEIEKEFGESKYGKEKYSEKALFWVGYIYRYICYTREVNSKTVYKLIKPKQLLEMYYVYHTQSEEYVVSSILELKGLNENDLDFYERQKAILKKYYKA